MNAIFGKVQNCMENVRRVRRELMESQSELRDAKVDLLHYLLDQTGPDTLIHSGMVDINLNAVKRDLHRW